MGITQSMESVLTAAVLAGVLGLGYHYYYTTSPSEGDANAPATASADANSVQKSKKKKKKGLEAAIAPASTSPPELVHSSNTIPGQFDQQQHHQQQPLAPVPLSSNPKAKKPKKKTISAKQPPDTLVSSSSLPDTVPSHSSSGAAVHGNTEGSWTRVVTRRRQDGASGGAVGDEQVDVTTSDAGLTSSVTGNSSPIEEEKGQEDQLQTLAERLVPKNPQTNVDDMLPDHNQPMLSRVMRVQPLPDEKPAPGFSWRDYEDVDADGEDDGWGVVKSKRLRASASTSTTTTTKPTPQPAPSTQKQRQNAKKRDGQKAAKAAAESERLAALAKHKRELEKARIIEQSRSGGKTGKVSGGMAPVVDATGKLVWE